MAAVQWEWELLWWGRARAAKECDMGPCCGCGSPPVLQLERRWKSRSEDDRSGPRGRMTWVIEGCGEDNISQILGL